MTLYLVHRGEKVREKSVSVAVVSMHLHKFSAIHKTVNLLTLNTTRYKIANHKSHKNPFSTKWLFASTNTVYTCMY